jgi:UTP--glucose-1-phosphate uridylyltransferase
MVKQAIIPLAGLGTRMLPLSKAFPKELWPLGSNSILEKILDECFEAGIQEVIFVISKKKNSIKKYFLKDRSLEKKIKNKPDIFAKIKKLNQLSKKIKFVYQSNPRGLGHAVLCAKKAIKSKYFLLALPDDIIIKKNCTKELISLHKKNNSSVIALRKVMKKEVSRYGIVGLNNSNHKIKQMIEKPSLKKAPSQYAIIGRYLLNKSIFQYLEKQQKGKLGEIQITDAMNAMLINENFFGCKFKGKYLDCGTINGYINSFIEINKS